jgi:O-antigen ligase
MNLLRNFSRGVEKLGGFSAIALGFSIPISVAIDHLLLAVVLACFVAGAGYRGKLAFVAGNPALLPPVVLFGLLTLGTLYGAAAPGEARHFLFKYVDLLFIPVLAVFFRDPAARRTGLYAFAAAIIATLLLSFAIYGSLARSPLLLHDEAYAVPFKHSLTHAILMGFGAFLFVQFAVFARSTWARWAWLLLGVLAVANMTFVVPGRTGYVVLGALILYTGFALWRWRGLIRMAVLFVLVLVVAYHASDRFHDRIARALNEYSAQRADLPVGADSAVGLRVEFYRNSLALVRDHPFVGVGTGSFRSAYEKQVKGSAMTATSNPHNEYLLVAVQLGILGVLAVLCMFWVQWRNAPRLASPLEATLARGLVLTIGIGCMFNSLLIDHTEGLLYAWLTALLYAGLRPGSDPQRADAGRQGAPSGA